jgi:hypothetical protein
MTDSACLVVLTGRAGTVYAPEGDAMSDAQPPTPGQICYEGAWKVHQELYPKAHRVPWRELHPAHKRGWEAAAQAVLAQCTPQKETP